MEAQELHIWISNHAESWRALEHMAQLYERRIIKGTYDSALAAKGLAYAVEIGARSYAKTHCTSEREWSAIFPAAIRRECANMLRNYLETEWRAGNYWGPVPVNMGV